MIYVLVDNKNDEYADAISKMMDSVSIESHTYEILDISKDEIIVDESHLRFLAFGKETILFFVKKLVSMGFIDHNSYVGKPLVDEESGFFFYGVHIGIPDIMRNIENKLYVFEILQKMAEVYKKWIPFNDEIPFGKEEQETVAITQGEVGFTNAPKEFPEDKIHPGDLINELIDKVDFNDQGLGKTLVKFDKIALDLGKYTMYIYPTARVPEEYPDNEIHITYKDLLSLIKVIMLTNANSIEFMNKN